MKENKTTKREYFEILKEIVTNSTTENKEEIIEFLDKQIELVDRKAEKAKERNAERKAAGDELRAYVESLLTDEFQTIDAMMESITDEEITRGKVTSRLTQLVKADIAVRDEIKIEGKKSKVAVYKLK
jgi:hypothetical protein